jgi:hypothetical protein
VPLFILANVVLFVLTMYVNDCPAHARATGAAIGGSVGESATAQGCLLAPELGRFAFQSFKENPLIGPTSATYGTIQICPKFGSFCSLLGLHYLLL